MAMNCAEIREQLLDFVEGELPPGSLAEIEAHLDGCTPCAERARETRVLVGDLSAARSVQQHAFHASPTQAYSVSMPTAGLPRLSILGDFEIIEELGRGGMGVVYRARQITLNRMVALKVLSSCGADSDRAVERFLKEAQAAARLHHTNIVPIYGQGHEHGCFYYAMELVDGHPLDKLLREQQELNRTVSPRERSRSWVSSAIHSISHLASHAAPRDFKTIARQVAEVAEALQHAHDQGVVHRDIKPQNLLLGRDDKLHITDFGLARLLDQPGLTRTTEMVGTPAYMAPEQIHSGARVDHRADIYSLGVTLYEMLTLERPFRAETYDQMIHQVLKRDPRPPRKLDPHVPMDLETICLRAMEKEPLARFATAADLARELRRYADDYPIISRRVGPFGKITRWVKRNPARASAVAACGLSVVLGGGAWMLLQAYANRCIDAAFRQLMIDYDDPAPALAELNRAPSWAGDRRRAALVLAFADIKQNTAGVISALDQLERSGGRQTDALYLRAWAYARLADRVEAEWSTAENAIRAGDELAATNAPSGAGLFFKGQTLIYIDPLEAYEAYRAALAAGAGPQAALHQGRAANNVLLIHQNPGYSSEGEYRLRSACNVRPDKAYPRYLLSINYRLLAEFQVAADKSDEAERAYENSLKAARDAQMVESDDPRGYIAEAEYNESRATFGRAPVEAALRDALSARASIERTKAWKQSNIQFAPERWAYAMRIHFWLAEYQPAQRAREERYERRQPHDATSFYDADDALYRALIARSAGDVSGANEALEAGLRSVGRHAEERLKLAAAFALCGVELPVGFWPTDLDCQTRRSARWTPRWLAAVVRYFRDEIPFDDLKAMIGAEYPSHEGDRRRAITGAEFYRGVKAIYVGDRVQALDALTKAHKQHDMENYCFRAKLLWFKMERDKSWPAWLPRSASRVPETP